MTLIGCGKSAVEAGVLFCTPGMNKERRKRKREAE